MSTAVSRESVIIAGAGLCGSLLAILLARRGFRVDLLERREDPRTAPAAAGRSINLALSSRGIRALRQAGVFGDVEPLLLPMRGRMLHEEDGSTRLLPYGQRDDEVIWSVSRASLNRVLVDSAAASPSVSVRFRHEIVAGEAPGDGLQVLEHGSGRRTPAGRPLIAADGAGSAVRTWLRRSGAVAATESLLPHGYKELAVPPEPGGGFRLAADALHIWPRGEFMLIALPNPGGDFTLTLFMPTEGPRSFAGLSGAGTAGDFFARRFPDVAPLIPRLEETFARHPVGLLGTVHSRPWHVGDVLLIGDAAHAIVPFHGQGMNLAFEDCRLLDGLAGSCTLREAFARFDGLQRGNAEAIAAMALENYVEMRDTVRDAGFALRKALAFELEKRLPERFIPRYSMVMFHDEIPYAVARDRGAIQERLLGELTRGRRTLEEIDLDAAEAAVRAALPPVANGAPVSRDRSSRA